MSRSQWKLILQAPCAALLLASVAGAQISGPDSGFAYDPNGKAIRLIVGVPGAAYLGNALLDGLDGAAIAPDGRSAVAAKDGRLLLIGVADGAVTDLGEWSGDLALTAWSADSTAVALKGGRLAGDRLALVRGIGRNAELAAIAQLDDEITAIAVAGSGDAVIAATRSGLYRAGADSTLLALLPDTAALAATPAGDRIFAAAGKQIYSLSGLDASAELAIVLSDAAGLEAPSALAVAADGSLYIGDRGAHKLIAVNPATGEALYAIDLAFEPVAMSRAAGGRFVLSPAAGDSVEIFDPARQAVLFVPQAGVFEAAAGAEE
ncbi:MAG: hypothetical protein R2729_30725 [Bryobacteraceae bacterium]